MTFLELCKKLRSEAGKSGVGPVTVTDRTGIEKKIVEWTNDAWIYIQNYRSDWLWMYVTSEFNTIAGIVDYTPASAGVTSPGVWDTSKFKFYKTADGKATEQFCSFISYDTWNSVYNVGVAAEGSPYLFTISPSNNIIFVNTIDDIYTVTTPYQSGAVSLENDADIPEMPERFHMAIVHFALMLLAPDQNALELYQTGEIRFNDVMTRLQLDQLPPLTYGEPLA